MKPKKHLGQNFLKKESVARDLVRAAKINTEDVVVEVGPGMGAITTLLLRSAKKVVAVEKDRELVLYLKKKFAKEIGEGKLLLVHTDILDFNPSAYRLEPSAYIVVGAIPYFITGALFKYFLSMGEQPRTIAFIVQKEVAERIVARGSKESILSLSIKVYGTPHYIKTIPANAFYPTPKVDSAILVIEYVSKQFFNPLNLPTYLPTLNVGKLSSEKEFFGLVRAGFSSKRKKLISNLKKRFPQTNFEGIFNDLKIDENIRAEDLTLEEWRKIFLAINP